MNTNWRCPFCGHHSVLTDERYDDFDHEFGMGNKHGSQRIYGSICVCSNARCREYELHLSVAKVNYPAGGGRAVLPPHHSWRLIPESQARVFPSYIPKQLLDDYQEACLICDKSPKASATLSRRCLQGMLRNFWGVKPGRLVDEIDQIQGKVDPTTWEAIDSLRHMGNIGAHMEKDINVIVDVDPGEAELLVQLLETLFEEWYVAKHEREERMKKIKAAADAKDAAKKAPKTGGTSTS
jgi:Domain of unknown function (DUF4145)